jgi:hypothetical protein
MNKIYFFQKINNSIISDFKNWFLNKNFKNPVILTEPYGTLNTQLISFCPIYLTRDIIQVSSDIDEKIYEETFQYKKLLSDKIPLIVKNSNIIIDILNVMSIGFEQIFSLKEASLDLLKTYDVVIICLEHDSPYYRSIPEWSYKNKLSSSNETLIWDSEQKEFINFKETYIKKEIPNIFRIMSYNVVNSFSFLRKKEKELKKLKISSLILDVINNNTEFIKKKNKIKKSSSVLMTLTTNGPLYRSNFSPIYNAYLEKNIDKPILIAPKWLREDAIKNNFTPIIIEDIKISEDKEKTINKIALLIIKFEKKLSKIFRYKKEDLFFIILKTAFNLESTYRHMINSILNFYKINEMLKTFSFSCIYKDCISTVYDNTLFSLAKNENIPVISSVHASFTEKRRSFPVYNTNYVTVIGENQKEPILKHGYKDNQIILAGQPELDEGFKQWNLKQSYEFIKKNFQKYDPNKKSILIATSTFDSKNEIIWVKTLCEYAAKRNDIQIFIKPHVGWEKYYEPIKDYQNTFLADQANSLYPYLIIADLVLTDNSHAGKLAIYLKKQLTVVNISNINFPFHNFNEEGLADFASSEDALLNHITLFLNGENMHEKYLKNYNPYIKHNFTASDGKSADRIVDFILSFGSKNAK